MSDKLVCGIAIFTWLCGFNAAWCWQIRRRIHDLEQFALFRKQIWRLLEQMKEPRP